MPDLATSPNQLGEIEGEPKYVRSLDRADRKDWFE